MTRHGVLKSGITHAFERERIVAQCVTCGSELHPERAEKYDYCMAPECQEKNLKGLTMVAVDRIEAGPRGVRVSSRRAAAP